VAYAREGHDAALQALAGKGSPRILRATARPPVQLRPAAARRLAAWFRRAMLSHLPDIGYGQRHEPAATQPGGR
jgi:methylated-DNA-[protein]-cysteine S-methyltransferase